jgi:HPt (histidine-containing phosphotransfer) domain-containing protein
MARDQVIQGLEDWGCDIEGSMPRFLDNRDLYYRLVKTIPDQKEFLDLGKDLEAKNITAAFDDAHALKGVLANMGLTPLYEETCQIVEPLRAGKLEGTEAHYEKLMELLTQFVSILKNEGR